MIRLLILCFFVFSCAEQDSYLQKKPESQNKKLGFSVLSENFDFQADHQADPPHFSGVGKARFNQKLKLYNFKENVFYILLGSSFAHPEKTKDLAEDKVVLHLLGDENLHQSLDLIITPMFDCDRNPYLSKKSEVSKVKNKNSLTYSKEESFKLKDSLAENKKQNCKPILQIVFLDENKDPAESLLAKKYISFPTDSSKASFVFRFSIKRVYPAMSFSELDANQIKDQYELESISDLEKNFERKKELIEEDEKDEIKKMQAKEKRKAPPSLLTPHQLSAPYVISVSIFTQSDLKDESYVDLFSHEGNFKCIRKGYSQFEKLQSYMMDTECGTIYHNHYLGKLKFPYRGFKELHWGLSLSGTATIVNRVDLQYEYDSIERDKTAYALKLGQIQETKKQEIQIAAAHMIPNSDSYEKSFTEGLKEKYLLSKEYFIQKACKADSFFHFFCPKNRSKQRSQENRRKDNSSKALYIENPDKEEEDQ